MIELKDIDRELANVLLENVLNRAGLPTYTEVAKELSKRLNRKINAHYNLAVPLGNVSTLCFELGLPLLSARVVYSGSTDSRAIGDGFHSFACQFRPEYKTIDPVAAWKNELKLIRECPYWNRLRQYIDGISKDEILRIKGASTKVEVPLDKNDDENPTIEEHTTISTAVFPDEVDASFEVKEGTVKVVNVNVRERNPIARQKCIEYHGTVCKVCAIDLGDIYGHEFSGKIHVHHLKPIGEFDGEHDIDPIKDLCPVCPNCHMIIHCRQDKPYSIDEVKAIMNSIRH